MGSEEVAATWKVVGGGEKGGILVRSGRDLKSPEAPDRLSTGAVVREEELVGDRLHYTLVNGAGPSSGWVSTKVAGKDLLLKQVAPGAKPSTLDALASPHWYSKKPCVKDRKIRVACLHGTASNASVMKMQIGRLSMLGKDKLELVFIEANQETEKVNPENKEVESMKKNFPGQQFFQYAVCPDQRALGHRLDYTDIGEAADYVRTKLIANAPIDGIFGFSQGANISHLLAAQAIHGVGDMPPLAFVVFNCGGIPAYTERYAELFGEPMRIPTLFIQGEADMVTDSSGETFLRPSTKAAEMYHGAEFASHSGDHRPFPRDAKEAGAVAATVVDFMQRAVE
eukprot:TRINITY_DN17745_c0_g1_i1.p1 TRINITY_DN17745_c0_g1~~TRINITY_DN17745_c0_g1_i1.p1  ORF type:complete len:340 (+),score=56.85 TRINITY_DN17745_c0_g1_i1:181-1200(+)